MDSLPPEILEHIFAHMPMLDLITVQSLVCKKWRDIIARDNFLPWKKSYFYYKMNDLNRNMDGYASPVIDVSDGETSPNAKRVKLSESDDREEERSKNRGNVAVKSSLLLRRIGEAGSFENNFIKAEFHLNPPVLERNNEPEYFRLETGLPWLIDFVVNEFTGNDNDEHFEQVKFHSKFSWAQDWFAERAPEFKDSNLAAVVFLAAIADDAWDAYKIFQALTWPSSKVCPGSKAVEVMYCVAVAFLVFHRKHKLPMKYHYKIFHAITFFENEFRASATSTPSPKKTGGGQSSLLSFGFVKKQPKVNLTAEQIRIAQHKLEKNKMEVVKIVAFAGTGKTTTLIKMCQEHPELKFLVVMYNKPVREYAETVFPKGNVRCTTAHSLAMSRWGFRYSKKLTSNLKAKDIIDSDLLSSAGLKGKVGGFQRHCAQVLKTLENFMNSPDMEITSENVPSIWSTNLMDEATIKPQDRQMILEDAITIWSAMNDPSNQKIKMPHDGYLKSWQLRKPNLQYKHFAHDVLMIDEGQDMNPAMLDIFMSQNTTKIIVGDPNQQIYTFRGAVNALESVEATHTYRLTQSFRFGPEIAYAAQSCLEFSNVDNDRLTLVGGRNKDKLINRDEITNARDFKPIAIVARTNLGLFNEVVRLVCETEKPPASCFAGGIKNCNFDDLRDIYYLAVEEKHKMKEGWKKRFKTLDSFEAFVTNINDIEMIGKIKTVKKYGNRLPNLLNKIEKHCKSDPKTADYVFTTAHKAKGLEWKTVVLMDDFADLRDGLLTPEEVFLIRDNDNDEMNLLYVAMTRAKKYLVLNHVILNLLVSRGDFSDKVISNRGGEKEHFVCGDCRANVAKEDNVLQLTRNRISVDSFTKNSGLICSLCSGIEIQHYRHPEASYVHNKSRTFLRYVTGAVNKRNKEALDHRAKFEVNTWQGVALPGGPEEGVLDVIEVLGDEMLDDDSDDSEIVALN